MASKGRSHIQDEYLMVAAIDFGTTYTGYAFSFKNTPNDIRMNKNWGEGEGFQSYKTPTSVLTGPAGDFMAFGFDAERQYSDSGADEDDQRRYHLYRHFKMMLYGEKHISRETTIVSVDGQRARALDIFSMALQYIKDHLINVAMKSSFTERSDLNDGIKWVLTVPAIWDDQAKQFMREAAYKAGLVRELHSKMLMIALEPEAASMYCRTLDIAHFACGPGEGGTLSFSPGTKYMVVDAGGGTIDITLHEILPNGRIKELHTANGGAWGGTKVDEKFIELMENILDKRFTDYYRKECPDQWLNLMTSFERVKPSVKNDSSSKILIPLAWSIGSKYSEMMGSNIEKVIKGAAHMGVKFSNGALILQKEAIDGIFRPVTGNIVQHIHSLMELPDVREVSYILLVGGFGECQYLQDRIKEEFGHRACLLVPSEAQMAVKKGAVLFGHQPDIITSRISRFSYGVKMRRNFIDGVHDISRLIISETGRRQCRGIFDPFVLRGEEVQCGKVISKNYSATSECTQMKLDLYRTEKIPNGKVDMFVDSPDMENIGLFYVDMPNYQSRNVRLDVVFGGTEIDVCATDIGSGSQANASIDFLTD